MGCGGCGHKYFRPPRTRSVGEVAKVDGVQQRTQRWRYTPRSPQPTVVSPKEVVTAPIVTEKKEN